MKIVNIDFLVHQWYRINGKVINFEGRGFHNLGKSSKHKN